MHKSHVLTPILYSSEVLTVADVAAESNGSIPPQAMTILSITWEMRWIVLCTKMILSLLFTKSITVFVEWLSKDKWCLLIKPKKKITICLLEGREDKKVLLLHLESWVKIMTQQAYGGVYFLRRCRPFHISSYYPSPFPVLKHKYYSSYTWYKMLN